MSRAQRILAVIVGLITGVLLMESYGAMVDAARAGGRAIPELWPLGTEGPGPGRGGVGAGDQAARASGGAAAVVAVAGRFRGSVDPAPGGRGPSDPGRVSDRRGDPGVAAG
jgi:hypothetical protein